MRGGKQRFSSGVGQIHILFSVILQTLTFFFVPHLYSDNVILGLNAHLSHVIILLNAYFSNTPSDFTVIRSELNLTKHKSEKRANYR